MKRSILAVSFLALACRMPPPAAPVLEGRVVDLSYAFDAETIYWPTDPGFVLEQTFAGFTDAGFYYAANRFHAPEHGGTHMDAPIHFWETGLTVDAVPVDKLIGPGVVIDVSEACARDADYLVTASDFETWEDEHGRIPDGAMVLLRTGFGRFWPDRVRYMGTDELGAEAVARLHFPGLDPAAAARLAEERRIHAVGLDTPSIDHGPSTSFESHLRLFRSDIPALENVANLDKLPPRGFTVIALPMKIRGGSGGPTRIIAILPS